MKEREETSDKVISNKILFVNLEGRISGAEKSMLLTVKHLPSGFFPEAACPEKGELADQLREMGVQVFSLPNTPKKYNYFAVWMLYFWIVNLKIFWITLLRKPQLIHANTTKSSLAVLLGVLIMRIKLISHVRDAGSPKWVLRILSICSSKIIAVSQVIRSQLLTKGVQKDKVEVISNSIDLTQEKLYTCCNIPESPFTFASIGQFVPWKNQLLFINAAEAYLDKGWKAKFLIVGEDVFGRDKEYEQLLRRRIKKSPFSDSFEFVPWQKELNSTWQGIDCLVHTADREPFGRVVIEAMGKCIPVIAADAFGPSEILEDCITGFLFEPNDVHELCCCMEIASQSPRQVRNIVLAGYQYVLHNYDIHKTIKQFQAIYSKVLVA